MFRFLDMYKKLQQANGIGLLFFLLLFLIPGRLSSQNELANYKYQLQAYHKTIPVKFKFFEEGTRIRIRTVDGELYKGALEVLNDSILSSGVQQIPLDSIFSLGVYSPLRSFFALPFIGVGGIAGTYGMAVIAFSGISTATLWTIPAMAGGIFFCMKGLVDLISPYKQYNLRKWDIRIVYASSVDNSQIIIPECLSQILAIDLAYI